MIVVTLTDCPPKLRGDLSKWLMEINTGVYVGKLSARVREELWKRICENLLHGRATMVFSTNNEQGLDFYTYNTSWTQVDFDGIKLMRRPVAVRRDVDKDGKSKASVQQVVHRKEQARIRKAKQEGYVVIDVETTGLNRETDVIIELAGIRIVNHEITDRISFLIQTEKEIPQTITELTGIDNKILEENGICLDDALQKFCDFLGDSPIVSHNISFDRSFINRACLKCGKESIKNVCKDTLAIARRKVDDIENYKLKTLAEYFKITVKEEHRAFADCITTYQLYEKLNGI